MAKLKALYNELVEKYALLQKLNKDLQAENDRLKELIEELTRIKREQEDEIKRLMRELQFLKDTSY